ncbi:hydrolase, partial [Rhodococcus rhodochrous]
GRYLRHPAVSVLHRAVRRAPRVMQGSMRVGGRMCAPVVRRGATDSWARSLATTLTNETSIVTLSRFLAAFAVLDESAALAVLAAIPVLVVGGSADELTPFAHSRAIAARLPAAELVRVDGAGHSLIVERADEVAAALLRLLTHVRGVATPVGVV